jgi:hypothetical protein
MSPKLKLMATFYTSSYARGRPEEVLDEKDAVAKGLARNAFFFTTHVSPVLELNGRTFTAQDEPREGRIFLGVDSLALPADVIGHYEERLAGPVRNRAEYSPSFRKALQDTIDDCRMEPRGKLFVPERYPCVDYVRLKPDDKVFNQKGGQIWPRPERG